MNGGSPLVSVIVPVFKGVWTLQTALESVMRQSFGNWECICVDDGSTDGSGALVDEISRRDSRIRVIHQKNGGTSVARNAGLDVAQGRYIAFLDEDDAYHPKFLETLYVTAVRTGADITGCDVLHFKDDDRLAFETVQSAELEWQVAGHAELAEWMTKFYYGVPFEVWRNLYRRELVADFRFKPGVRIEQDLLWHYALLPKVRFYAKTVWRGYAWRESATGGYLHPDAESMISLLESYRFVLDEVADAMALLPLQRRALANAVTTDIRWNVWRHLRAGIPLSRSQSALLRMAVRTLCRRGADVRKCLSRVRRWQWNLFMLVGWQGFVRK